MKIFLSAGEPSGDEHAAKLALELSRLLPGARIHGMGGSGMRAAGVSTFIDCEVDASIMGFADVLLNLPKIRSSLRKIEEFLTKEQPAIAIFVDYQDFHFQAARIAKRLGIPTLFYISPSIWAWRPGRVKTVQRFIDCMACIFPFEPELYERAGYHGAVYVGHPLHEQFAHNAIGPELRRNIRLELFPADPDAPLLAILPGSRSKEIVTHIPILRETIALLSQHGNSPHIVIPVAKNVVNHLYLQELQQLSGLILTDRNAMEIMQVADAVLIKSGTSNLQAAFCDLPFAMFFKTNRLTEFLIRNLSSLRNFSIVNIIQENSVRELLQNDCNAQALATEARRLLGDEEYRNSIRMNLQNVRMALAGHGTHPVFEASDTPSLRVARLAKEIIDQKIAL